MMAFQRTVDGIEIMLSVDNYKNPKIAEFENSWCKCSFSFKMGDMINVHLENDETLMSEEIDTLVEVLTDLINEKIEEVQECSFVERYFSFLLYPVKDLRENPECTYVAPGYEFQDIYLEWRIYLWKSGYNLDSYLSVTLYREDIIALRNYLESCREAKAPKKSYRQRHDPEKNRIIITSELIHGNEIPEDTLKTSEGFFSDQRSYMSELFFYEHVMHVTYYFPADDPLAGYIPDDDKLIEKYLIAQGKLLEHEEHCYMAVDLLERNGVDIYSVTIAVADDDEKFCEAYL